MARMEYKLKNFDAEMAEQGALCAMVIIGTGASIYNIGTDGTTNSNFMGVGICKKESSECYSMIVNSVYYKFTAGGKCIYPSTAKSYMLKMATPNVSLNTAGNNSASSSTVVSSRGSDGKITTKVNYEQSSDIVIDTLNARDEFAVHALRELLCHVDNPSVLSDNEMNFYCNRAYQWAANMMSASANARSTFKQEAAASTGTTETKADTTDKSDVDTSTLTSNTEKLLNNIVSALERTDYVESTSVKDTTTGTTTTTTTYYDRVKLQFSELMDFLNTYVKNDKTVYSMKDLLTSINTVGTNIKDYKLTDLITAVNTVGTNIKDHKFADLITAVNALSTNVNTVGTNVKNQDFTSLVDAIKAIKLDAASDINIGTGGVGGSKDKPLYMSGGGFPTRASLAASLVAASIDSFLTFNSNGAVAYSTLAEVKKAVLGWYSSYANFDAFLDTLKVHIQGIADERIKKWLAATTVTYSEKDGYKVNVPDSI